jgi:hypothetical protein
MNDWKGHEWKGRIAAQLVSPEGSQTSHATIALEIALGVARGELAFVLELGRAHGLPVSGSIVGDDVWIRIGASTLRFNFSRRAGVIVASIVGRGDAQLKWTVDRGIVGPDGMAVDVDRYVRDAVEATINAWRARPDVTISMRTSDRPPAPTLPDVEEPPKRRY